MNPNPLRSLTLASMPPLRDGVLQFGVEQGTGPALSLEPLAEFLVAC